MYLIHRIVLKTELSGNKQIIDKITREMRQNIIEKMAYGEQINDNEWKCSMARNLIEGNFYKVFHRFNNKKTELLN